MIFSFRFQRPGAQVDNALRYSRTRGSHRVEVHPGRYRHIDKQARGEMTTQQLADWATMLLLNGAYRWDDEDAIAEWLHDISSFTTKPNGKAE